MVATIIDGKALGAELRAELHNEVQRYVQQLGRPPGLVIVRVEGDTASGVYSRAILRIANEVGVQARLDQLPADISPAELHETIQHLNRDTSVHGIIVQMPLPVHLSQQMIAETIAPEKDIDGISPYNAGNLLLGFPGFLPSTAAAVMEILERTHTSLEGMHVVMVGRSNVVGKPLSILLLQKHATVTICHSRTMNLSELTRQGDILVVATGRANMVTADMVHPGAIVIDVGINARPGGGIVGDVDFESVQPIARAITPTPGGVGPLTNVVLLKQCIQAAWQQSRKKA